MSNIVDYFYDFFGFLQIERLVSSDAFNKTKFSIVVRAYFR